MVVQGANPPPLVKRCKIFREKQRKLVPISWPHASRAHLMAFFVSERLNFGLYVENGAMENLNAAISIARRHLSVLKEGRPKSLHHSHSDHDDSTHLAVRSWCPGRTLRGPGTNSPPQPTFHPVQKRASQSHRRVCVDITRIVGSGTFSAGGLGARDRA